MRADAYLAKIGRFPSRNKAAEAIARSEVFADGKVVKKPSQEIADGAEITISETAENFASNGGFKLQKAFEDFSLEVNGFSCVDVGASNGGFTDCLLRNGARKVFAVNFQKNSPLTPKSLS